MPKFHADLNYDRAVFYGAYVKTYIERDVRDLTQVGDEIKFVQFMTVLASRTEQILNLSAAARDIGINLITLKADDKVLPVSFL